MADFGASWLGWDVVKGRTADQFDLVDLRQITKAPHRYGFHGTLKPPFRLSQTQSLAGLETAAADLAATLAPAVCDGLELATLGRFLALVPMGGRPGLQRIAQACVQELDIFRAPAEASELARRRAAGLSPRQEALLVQWGYPYVLEEFRFHLTLTGRLPQEDVQLWSERVGNFLPKLPAPFVIDQIALCGERAGGRFEMLHRYRLSG